MTVGLALAISVGLLGLNAFFVGAEFALISARRSEIEPRADAGSRVAGVTLKAMERVSLMMAAAQLGITLCTLGLGALAKPAVGTLLEDLFGLVSIPDSVAYPVSVVLALLLVASLHVVIGEMVPKNIAVPQFSRHPVPVRARSSPTPVAPFSQLVLRPPQPHPGALIFMPYISLRSPCAPVKPTTASPSHDPVIVY